MNEQPAITAAGLSKVYRLGQLHEPYKTLRDTIARAASKTLVTLRGRNTGQAPSRSRERFAALHDVSFCVDRGEVLGVIGHNGAGKTTLLKILARITSPTDGRIELRGRVGSLLEVGTGFHGELTGRENVFLNGAILGMRRAEIQRKLDEILEFAEVTRFADTPVKRFSSGMYLRLAFAVAAHLETEILLVDEVLAVGDARFQKRCLGKMGEVANQGRTILFVSHNMGAVASLCDRGLVLSKGEIEFIGPTEEATAHYLKSQLADAGESGFSVNAEALAKHLEAPFQIERIELVNPKAPELGPRSGDPLVLRVRYRATQDFVSPGFWVRFKNLVGQEVFRFSTRPISGFEIERVHGKGLLELHLDELPLVSGTFSLDFALTRELLGFVFLYHDLVQFHVAPGDVYGSGMMLDHRHGLVHARHRWEHRPHSKD